MWDHPVSSVQMRPVFDCAPIAVTVRALEHGELLYQNRIAQDLMAQTTLKLGDMGPDLKMQSGQADPLCRENTDTWEMTDPESNRTYRCTGTMVDWDHIPAYVAYIQEIPKPEKDEAFFAQWQEEFFHDFPCGLGVYRIENEHMIPHYYNSAFFTTLGCSDEHITQIRKEMRFTGVHPEDLPLLQEKLSLLIHRGTILSHTIRIYHDNRQEYRWIHVDGSLKHQEDGAVFLYGIYSDVSEQVCLEKALSKANEKMEDIINAIPGGVAIYQVTDRYETVYFSEGVPALTGYTTEEYQDLIQGDAVEMTYWEDTPMVVSKTQEVIRTHQTDSFEFRKIHRDGHMIWVRVQVKWMGEENGFPLLHCVFHNITDFKKTQLSLEHLIHSIPGGIASYQMIEGRFRATFLSDGMIELSGYSREEYQTLTQHDALHLIYESDRSRVYKAATDMLKNSVAMNVSCRIRCKNGQLSWVHLNGRLMGPVTEIPTLHVVFTGMSAEARLFQSIANETADGIYVFDRETYELLYVNESNKLFTQGRDCVGLKCHEVLRNNPNPCPCCPLHDTETHQPSYDVTVNEGGTFYNVRFRQVDWNGIPAYIAYVRDITDEVNTRKDKERLESYFQTVVKNLPGGVTVVRYEADGQLIPEFLSDGFASMTNMSMEDAWRLYAEDAVKGVHPEDQGRVNTEMANFIASGDSRCELIYRLKKGSQAYIWVKNTLSLIRNEDGVLRVYCSLHDITREREEQERIRRQYQQLILQHYRTPNPNAIIVGHCNITRNRILEVVDRFHLDLLRTVGMEREKFFRALATLLADQSDREAFLQTFLNEPSLAAFHQDIKELSQTCIMQVPGEDVGRYVRIQVNMLEEPDTGDITGILTISDITDLTISDRILHGLAITGFDFVIDLNLAQDQFTILSYNKDTCHLPPSHGSHKKWIAYAMETFVVPKDIETYQAALEPERMLARLQEEGAYSFTFSMIDESGHIQTKKMTVSAIDLRLKRVCLSRTDITDSVRAQQSMLNMMTYTFEQIGFIDISSGEFTKYTRQTVLDNLPPYKVKKYDSEIEKLTERYGTGDDREEVLQQFRLEYMLKRLEDKPEGYDFAFPYRAEDGLRYKQINVLWGDASHRTVCLVRADVTDMLTAERNAKRTLEEALALAEEANRAKSDFLSAMSHDIRTPMNAIMGMTTLAAAHLENRERVANYLKKISLSSRHLLSLINDILDMSQIERSQVTLTCEELSVTALIEQVSAIIAPQTEEAGLLFEVQEHNVIHRYFYGDALHINQILINILSNALKFTPEGGQIRFTVEELPLQTQNLQRVRYRFVISDTGIGMSEEFLTKIFEPFSRSRAAAHVEGTGLGLSITKGLVDIMGGTIQVESQLQIGSVFCVELEFDTAQQSPHKNSLQPGETQTEKEDLLRGRHFLVAEDNAINAEILCELLKLYGASAMVKTDGAQAVQEFCNAPPGTYDAILMDVQMPVMNGYEATRAIRKIDRSDANSIPIVAMTANAFSEDVRASQDAGMTAHVAKPIDIDILCTTLYQVLR